ncbi:hypothetical protein BV898_10188 [Hypsibius exemplaris]|uniref:Methyltransferase domain-containing protein n=1 Tax=Hypsibius exemplaris TaxID=2072580 RepID=A0A1W0WK71_HYPEX|nr:hypothetical protein BV898_10188 [Hypsibius exemplaris]
MSRSLRRLLVVIALLELANVSVGIEGNYSTASRLITSSIDKAATATRNVSSMDEFYSNPKNSNPHFKATLNAHGHMLDVLDEYGEAFVAFARNTTKPVADLGVAFGFTTKEILKTGATVYANDLSEDMLKELNNSLTEEERLRCILKPGSALELNFEPGSLSGVLALRWFHFLTGPQIREVIHKFFTWLEPGGKVVITCSTPYSGRARSFIPEYEERKAAGEEWPGFTTKQIQEVGGVGSREHFHKLEPFIFERELKAAGFEVEKCGFIARSFYPEGWQFDGREHCGVVVHTCACEDLNNSTPSTSLGGDQTKRNPQFKATLNAHGHMLDVLDEYGEAFVAFARNTTNPVADLGVAFGFTTKEILKTGATVYANDLSEDMLKELNNSLTEEERLRCILKPGNALELEFEPGSLSGVLALRWFHFLTGPQIREVVHKFFTWLEPGGKVVITSGTPYSGRAKSFIPEYEARKAAGEEWPGSVRNVGSQGQLNMLEPWVLERELRATGFEVEMCGFIKRTFGPTGWRLDGREHCGVWYYQRGGERGPMPAYIVTPGCLEPLYLNQLAAAWNILLITTSSSDMIIKDKSKSPTWINTNVYPSLFYGTIFYRLCLIHNWTSVFVVLDDDAIPNYQIVFRAVDAIMKPLVRTVNVRYSSKKAPLNMSDLLDNFSRHSRVMVFLASASQFRLLLLLAAAKGQTKGEYVFIVAVPFPYKAQGIFTWKADDRNDEVIRAAYRSVLFVTMVDATLHVSETQMALLKSQWDHGFKTTPFYGNLDLHDEPAVPQLASVNGAIEMLAQVLNESLLDEGFDPRNGRDFARHFYNRTFETSSGRIVLDRFGDRAPSVSVSYFNDTRGDFQVFLQSNIVDGVFFWSALTAVSWFNGSELPPNEPSCGYAGDKPECLASRPGVAVKDLSTALGVVIAVLLFGSVYLGYLIRSRANNAKSGLDGNWWSLSAQLLEASTKRSFFSYLAMSNMEIHSMALGNVQLNSAVF